MSATASGPLALRVGNRPEPAWLLAAALLPGLAYLLQGHVGLSLWDEGFLWYGAQRVLAGEVPLRDFQSYDIGRYYWAAGVMALLGSDGILALRVANALLAAVTVLMVSTLLARHTRHRGALVGVLVAGTVLLWMTPDFKVADMFASACLLAGLTRLIERPGPGRCFAAGIAAGLAAVIGINHGLYAAIAGGAAGIWLLARRALPNAGRSLAAAVAGVAVGYAPMLAALALVPGFAAAFADSIAFLFELGATNIALPVPRFWAVRFGSGQPPIESLRQLAVGLAFFALPCAALAGLYASLRRAVLPDPAARALLVASSCLMPPYAHYAFSRADTVHLAGAVLPFLAAAYAASSPWPRAARLAACTALAGASALLMLPDQPGYALLRGAPLQWAQVGGDRLLVPPERARELALLHELAQRHSRPGQPFLAAPFWPGAYAVLRRGSPTWEIYGLFALSEARQRREIERIAQAGIGFAVIDDTWLDGRAALAWRATHPLIERHLAGCFARVSTSPLVPSVRIFTDPVGACQAS